MGGAGSMEPGAPGLQRVDGGLCDLGLPAQGVAAGPRRLPAVLFR